MTSEDGGVALNRVVSGHNPPFWSITVDNGFVKQKIILTDKQIGVLSMKMKEVGL